MYPRLRPDVLFLRVGGGIRVEGDSHAVTLRGSDVPSLAFTLLPLLDGRHATAAIAARFDPSARPRIARMIALLAAEGMVSDDGRIGNIGRDERAGHDGREARDASTRWNEPQDELPRVVRECFHASIEFLRHNGGDPFAGFQRFRASRVIIAGSGVAFRTCAASLARHGLAPLALLPIGDVEDVRLVRQAIDALPLGNLRPEVIVCNPDAIAKASGDAHKDTHVDAVIACTDAPDLAMLRALNRQCARAAIAFLPAFGLTNRIFLGPLMQPATAGCWTCGLLRIVRDLVEPARCAEVLRELQSRPDARGTSGARGEAFAADRALANRLGRDAALEMFKMLGGARRSLVSDTILAQHQDTNDGGVRAVLTPAVLGACLNHCRLVSSDAPPDPIYDIGAPILDTGIIVRC
jgi:hypothetical protein